MKHPMTDRLAEAVALGTTVHLKQVRKGNNTAYIGHPLAVASLVIEFGGDEDEAIAAVLHDVIEDGEAGQEDTIRERFGERVLSIVEGCTDGSQAEKARPKDKEGRIALWHERKTRYIAHLPEASPSTLLVSCCDKLHNAQTCLRDLRTHGLALYDRFLGGIEGTLWYYQSLAGAYQRLGVAPAEELAHVVDTLAEQTRLLQAPGRRNTP
jgi:(p)ppGpp synthase/HD superfamily hydrolase